MFDAGGDLPGPPQQDLSTGEGGKDAMKFAARVKKNKSYTTNNADFTLLFCIIVSPIVCRMYLMQVGCQLEALFPLKRDAGSTQFFIVICLGSEKRGARQGFSKITHMEKG
jgi:hypothetical protein